MQFGRYYEEFTVGDVYKHWPGRTITESDDMLFCMLTMNHHPLHIDANYAAGTQFGKPVVVGPLIYSMVFGMTVSDVSGNTDVTKPDKDSTATKPAEMARVWFGVPGKPLYEHRVVGRSQNGAAWDITTWAPRIDGIRPGYFQKKADGSFVKGCGDQPNVPLTQMTGDKAKAVLDKSQLMTEYLMRRAHMLARDDRGTYYYVDRLHSGLGGKGYRVWVGKKGAMKQLPLTDVATDTGGEVFATKTGDLRLDHDNRIEKMAWIRGEKRTELVTLDVDANSPLIFSDLGIYPFLGTICDNMR